MTDKQQQNVAEFVMILICIMFCMAMIMLPIKYIKPVKPETDTLQLQKPLEQIEIDNFNQQKK